MPHVHLCIEKKSGGCPNEKSTMHCVASLYYRNPKSIPRNNVKENSHFMHYREDGAVGHPNALAGSLGPSPYPEHSLKVPEGPVARKAKEQRLQLRNEFFCLSAWLDFRHPLKFLCSCA